MSYQHQFIQKLSQERSRDIYDVLNQVLRVSFPANSLKQVWLEKREGWVAVPTTSADTFRSAVLRIAEYSGDQELLGVFLDTYPDELLVFSVPANLDSLSEFDVEPPPGLKVLFAGAPDWIVLDVESDFYVVAGVVPAVEQSLNLSVDQAFVEFDHYIESWEFPAEFADRLQPLKDFPRMVYSNLRQYKNASLSFRVNLFERGDAM